MGLEETMGCTYQLDIYHQCWNNETVVERLQVVVFHPEFDTEKPFVGYWCGDVAAICFAP